MRLSRVKRPKALWWQIKHPDGAVQRPFKRIRHRSTLMSERMREYAKAARAWLTGRTCELCEIKPASEVHHSRGRLGALLMMKEFWRALCRSCHNWVGDHPTEARGLGLLCQPGEWNTIPRQDYAKTRESGHVLEGTCRDNPDEVRHLQAGH